MKVTMRAKQASEALAKKYKELKMKLATAEEHLTHIHKIGVSNTMIYASVDLSCCCIGLISYLILSTALGLY